MTARHCAAGLTSVVTVARRVATRPMLHTSHAHVWADQQRQLHEAGGRMQIEDSCIAATARRYDLTIVTGNDRHFRRPGLRVFNPFKELVRR
jgi:predicted nucleic acid-binding protein